RAVCAADARAGNAGQRTGWPNRTGPFAESMPVRLRQVAPRQVAVAVAQPRLMGVERLADAVDEHLLGGARALERVARPDHDVGAPAGGEATEIAAQSERLCRLRRDHRQC